MCIIAISYCYQVKKKEMKMKSPNTIKSNEVYRVCYRAGYKASMQGLMLKEILEAGNKSQIWWFELKNK